MSTRSWLTSDPNYSSTQSHTYRMARAEDSTTRVLVVVEPAILISIFLSHHCRSTGTGTRSSTNLYRTRSTCTTYRLRQKATY